MAFTTKQMVEIEHLITKGEKLDAIAEKIGGSCTWKEIQAFCWESGATSWQGSKKMISNRLKRLKTATTQSEREKLAKEIGEKADYLYYCAKEMRKRIQAVEKALQKMN